jgi:superfamily II DNA/RNA helicase
MSQEAREKSMASFKAGKKEILIATDVAARGIDVDDVTHVINHTIPEDDKAYLHRVGRAGHGGGSAEAFTFRCPTDEERWMHVERAMRVKLVAERPPAHGAYMRTRDGFAPDTESDPRTMRGATRKAHGQRASRSGNGARTAASGARSMGQRPAPAAASRARAGDEAPTTPSGRSLADLIRNAPKAVRKKRKRLQQGGGKAKAASNLRGKQRKAPIAKGQRPGGGVRRAT